MLNSKEIAIIGGACRLPGAANETTFWDMLREGRCAVGALPEGRWSAERFLHPRASEPGFSYTFAGGYLDNPFAFDPGVFGISPREAKQIDPQQRLLLEVVWEALENAGLKPSSLAGKPIGVYVGASNLDYGNLHTTDPAAIESHFMTGNTLSLVSNRISYAFDWQGPSFTVDTACSSSLVAFAEAMAAVESGRVDMAVVAGVNVLLSPAPFIGFSRASMLSPTGLCRPFSADGDGYVRSEGAVAFVIQRLSDAKAEKQVIRAVALAAGVNSDGRTAGVSLPSADGQRRLLEQVYGRSGIDPKTLSFVEAHGTGTRVGDPIEATAIGEALGMKRDGILPLGSVKSNIGHLEPASGVAGLLKALLSLEHKLYPRTLHLDEINPLVDFGALNLAPAVEEVDLSGMTGTLHAGVSSFGFGGTNAHVVLRAPQGDEVVGAKPLAADPHYMVISAQTRAALQQTAANYAAHIEADPHDLPRLAAASFARRESMSQRTALPLGSSGDMAAMLRNIAENKSAVTAVQGAAASSAPELCFVYSGNGAQWAGMGRAAYAKNDVFRARMDVIDALFQPLSGWSLVEAMHAEDLDERLKRTAVAQPMLFALQSAVTRAVAAHGLLPSSVIGHSVGEVAAAEAAGSISLEEAVRLIYCRSDFQEAVRGKGRMAAANISADAALALMAETGIEGVEIAAINSPGAITLAGAEAPIKALAAAARKKRVALRVLDLDYQFHTSILEPLKEPLIEALGRFEAKNTGVAFISTVTGDALDGETLDADYWWRNIRQPVRFSAALESAARRGAALFVEIGPRPILTANINDTLRDAGFHGAAIASFQEKDEEADVDPVRHTVARAYVNGAAIEAESLFGSAPVGPAKLPSYAWQRQEFSPSETSELLDIYGRTQRHPLIGSRLSESSPEWRTLLDASVVPYLSDHRIDGEIVVPGAGLAEMALAVARETFKEGAIGLEDFDLLQWMTLPETGMREISVRLGGDTRSVEIWSRPRLGPDEWTLHARGRIVEVVSPPPELPPVTDALKRRLPLTAGTDEVYGAATRAGVDYGPAFRRVVSMRRDEKKIIEVVLAPPEAGTGNFSRRQILHPVTFDAAFHALFQLIKLKQGETLAYLPVRFADLKVFKDSTSATRARIIVDRDTGYSISVSIVLTDETGETIASLEGGLFRAVTLARRTRDEAFFHMDRLRLMRADRTLDARSVVAGPLGRAGALALPESWIILSAFGRALAHETIAETLGHGPFTLDGVRENGAVAEPALPLVATLLNTLRAVGLAEEGNQGWTLSPESGLPAATDILATFTADNPPASAEIVLGAYALPGLRGFIRTGSRLVHRASLLEQFEASSLLFQPLLDAARDAVEALVEANAPDPVRVIVAEPGCLGLLRALSPLLAKGAVRLSVASTNAKRLSHAAARLGSESNIEFLELDPKNERLDHRFDIALGACFEPALIEEPAFLSGLLAQLSPSGVLMLLQPPADPLLDLFFGAAEGWFDRSVDPTFPVSQMPLLGETERALIEVHAANIETRSIGNQLGAIVVASRKPASDAEKPVLMPVAILHEKAVRSADPFVAAFTHALRTDGAPVSDLLIARGADNTASWSEFIHRTGSIERIDLVDIDIVELKGPASIGIEARITRLAALLAVAEAGAAKLRLWIILRGPQGSAGVDLDPAAEAISAFARVAANEYPSVDIRCVNIPQVIAEEDAATRLATLLVAPGAETEFLFDAAGILVNRAGRGLPTRHSGTALAPAARLEVPAKGGLTHFIWGASDQVEPKGSEIEVEVAAAGLNFRDVMLAQGLLNDDVLDDGLAGAVLGFECSGRITRIGPKVAGLAVGDAVMGFARSSFATHVTADMRVFTKVPETIALEAAATIPVAFLTAYYALVTLAQLKRGEWVLIHGAAGGVGLAAMQIARQRGARIAATVGSPDKRALVALMGAEKIYDSRSLRFADEIRRDLGGVDVVLNSISGEGMLASIKCVKPFGRFVELGKRDYVANTAMGLRPFRRNLTYFGVDLDQLLAADPKLAGKLMQMLARDFASGVFVPLPYRAFEASEVSAAFRLMQASGHVSKILIRPPTQPVPAAVSAAGFAPGPGAHVIVGGMGGFGFETAIWLLEKGAKTIVLASRRGALDQASEKRILAWRRKGATIAVETVDVVDPISVDGFIKRTVQKHGSIAGIMHTAVALDDGLISNLEPARTRAVLAPKVDGALNLHRTTRSVPLDYFLVFSSATTLIGNPGQAAYVAANAFMEGLMRRRRSAGLPGLAVAWGAISDAGILARNAETAKTLERMTGVSGMPVREALGHLDMLMGMAAQQRLDTVYCAHIRKAGATRDLNVFASPTFASAFASADEASSEDRVDFEAMLSGKSDVEARRIVASAVAGEVAKILRLSIDEVDVNRPLTELGMDSLMALELRMSVETKFGVELPIVAITSMKHLNDLADRLIASMKRGGEANAAASAAKVTNDEQQLLAQHTGDTVDLADFAAVSEAVEKKQATLKTLL